MKPVYKLFLEVISSGIRDELFTDRLNISQEEMRELLFIAENHKVLPLLYETIKDNTSIKNDSLHLSNVIKLKVQQRIRRYHIQRSELLSLLKTIQKHDLDPIIVKGIICQELYPQPFLRLSVDEDFIVDNAEISLFDALLQEIGLHSYFETEGEYSYIKPESPLYIELHRSLFPDNSCILNDLNKPFTDIKNHISFIHVEGIQIKTLDPTYHLLFLILHSFKHFIYSGFGIRNLCDIQLFTEKYYKVIDWKYIEYWSHHFNLDTFISCLYSISRTYLGFKIEGTIPWGLLCEQQAPIDSLLEDILESGIHGAEDIDRLHSSTITLNAFSSHQTHKKRGLLNSIFPTVKQLKGRYRYLYKFPWLLPVAWFTRGYKYLILSSKKTVSPVRTIEIGKKRTRLLKKYNII